MSNSSCITWMRSTPRPPQWFHRLTDPPTDFSRMQPVLFLIRKARSSNLISLKRRTFKHSPIFAKYYCTANGGDIFVLRLVSCWVHTDGSGRIFLFKVRRGIGIIRSLIVRFQKRRKHSRFKATKKYQKSGFINRKMSQITSHDTSVPLN